MKKLLAAVALFCLISVPAMAGEPFGAMLGSGSVSTAKMGTATCKQYFGIVSLGDCSVKTAMTNGKINTLSHADQYVKNILGFKTIEVRAYGN